MSLTDIELVQKLGEAIVIAAILAATVDISLKGKLAKEINTDVFHAVLGYKVPPEIRHEIENICSTKIYRKDLNIEIEFTDYGDDKLLYKFYSEYQLYNLGNRSEPYLYKVGVERSHELEEESRRSPENKNKFFQIQEVGATHVLDNNEGEGIDEKAQAQDLGEIKNAFRVWQREVYIPSSTDITDRTVPTFWLKTLQVLPKNKNKEIITLKDAVVGVKITIKGKPEWMDLEITSGFPRNKIQTTERANIFETEDAILPQQLIRIEWKEKNANTA
jgi:hypothetical protein